MSMRQGLSLRRANFEVEVTRSARGTQGGANSELQIGDLAHAVHRGARVRRKKFLTYEG